MSLVNKFSITYNIEQSNTYKKRLSQSGKDNLVADTTIFRECVSEDILNPLINFGYDLDQIMLTFKMYRFTSVEHALFLLMKDPDTKKYNHRFVEMNKSFNEKYEDVRKGQTCYLCGDTPDEHIDYEGEKEIKLDGDSNMSKIEDKDASLDVERSHNNMLKTSDFSGLLLERKNSQNNKMLNILKVDIPKETLDLFNDPNLCTICFNEVLDEKNNVLFTCGHKFCRLCVVNHLNTNIINGKVNKKLILGNKY